jgi:hypothetical protein
VPMVVGEGALVGVSILVAHPVQHSTQSSRSDQHSTATAAQHITEQQPPSTPPAMATSPAAAVLLIAAEVSLVAGAPGPRELAATVLFVQREGAHVAGAPSLSSALGTCNGCEGALAVTEPVFEVAWRSQPSHGP